MNEVDLRRAFTLANAFKEGDVAIGGTPDETVRAEARRTIGATTLGTIRRTPLVEDGVTDALSRARDRQNDAELDTLTVDRVKATLLRPDGPDWAHTYGTALASETIAAVVKVMTDDELSSLSLRLFNPLDGDGIPIGGRRHFGSRIQPNSPGDDDTEILFSILEGLSYGCGDVILGLNPAADDVETIVRLEQLLQQVTSRLDLPTRYCVLSDIVKQHTARTHTHIDVAFQSLAGTSRALVGMVGHDVDGIVDLACDFDALYFETGQGSEVTNGTAEGVDMVTLEARTYGLARHLRQEVGRRRRSAARPWMIVNDVAGFIGPEVFTNARQLERACLEDTAMAKLHGLTMGLDVCSTFHMGIPPMELRHLTQRIVERAAPAYLMAVAGNADPMLGYLTTSFREHPQLRRLVDKRIASRMERRLTGLGILGLDGEAEGKPDTTARLYAVYAKGGGDRRTALALEDEGYRRLRELGERGFDLGVTDPSKADARLDAIYAHARRALYATIADSVIRDASPRNICVRTTATNRDDYLAHPSTGERLRADDAARLAKQERAHDQEVQIVISDGLNADAVNEHLRTFLPPLRRFLAGAGCTVRDTDVVVQNGRVRAGYEIGGLVGAGVVVHLVGERPGTGLNTLSAYVTYGRDERGQSRWSRDLDHSATTAICGVHPRGKPLPVAAAEIARTVARVLDQRRSGVALR